MRRAIRNWFTSISEDQPPPPSRPPTPAPFKKSTASTQHQKQVASTAKAKELAKYTSSAPSKAKPLEMKAKSRREPSLLEWVASCSKEEARAGRKSSTKGQDQKHVSWVPTRKIVREEFPSHGEFRGSVSSASHQATVGSSNRRSDRSSSDALPHANSTQASHTEPSQRTQTEQRRSHLSMSSHFPAIPGFESAMGEVFHETNCDSSMQHRRTDDTTVGSVTRRYETFEGSRKECNRETFERRAPDGSSDIKTTEHRRSGNFKYSSTTDTHNEGSSSRSNNTGRNNRSFNEQSNAQIDSKYEGKGKKKADDHDGW